MIKKLGMGCLLLCSVISITQCMEAVKKTIHQLAIIKPFFEKLQAVSTLTSIMDTVEKKGLGYPDYDKRTGLIFSEFSVNTIDPKQMHEMPRVKIRTLVGDTLQDHAAQSSFDYPDIQKILAEDILPTTFKCIKENRWASLPQKVYAQLYLQRCHTGDPMQWHQDPGEYYDQQAHFSLVVLLSKQDDPVYGWYGGEFKIRPGLPQDEYNEQDVRTIIPEYNKGILFNNRLNNHSVTAVLAGMMQSKRDLLVVPLFFERLPLPIANAKK